MFLLGRVRRKENLSDGQSTDDYVFETKAKRAARKNAGACSSQEIANLIANSDLLIIPFLTRSLLEQMQVGMRARPRQKAHEGV